MIMVLIMVANNPLLFYGLFSPSTGLYSNYVINWKHSYFSVTRLAGPRGDFYR